MSDRLRYQQFSDAVAPLIALEKYLASTSLEPSLVHLVKMRASQINGCGFCLDMHSREAIADGDTHQRLHVLPAWRELPPFFTDRERAALAWTEAVTQISTQEVTDAIYETALEHFSEKELMDLNMLVIAINAWNRLAIPFHSLPKREA